MPALRSKRAWSAGHYTFRGVLITLRGHAAGVAEWYTQLTQNQPGVTP